MKRDNQNVIGKVSRLGKGGGGGRVGALWETFVFEKKSLSRRAREKNPKKPGTPRKKKASVSSLQARPADNRQKGLFARRREGAKNLLKKKGRAG